MRVERLFEIVTILLSKGTVSAKYLAQHFDVSTRTIYRDVDVLSVSGIPVYMKKGYGGGISLMEGYQMDKAMLSDKDIESILLSVGALSATNYAGIDTVLDKLSVLFKSQAVTDWVEIDFTDWDTNKSKDTRIEDIRKAILNRLLLEIEYLNSYGQRRIRTIAPLKLVFKARSWYVYAYSLDKEALRMFKIRRIKRLQVLSSSFNREAYLNLNSDNELLSDKANSYSVALPTTMQSTLPKSNFTELILKFKPDALYLLYDWYEEKDIVPQEDGTYVVKAMFPLDEWVFSHILSYGDKVEVVEPLFVRTEIKKRLKNIISIYK